MPNALMATDLRRSPVALRGHHLGLIERVRAGSPALFRLSVGALGLLVVCLVLQLLDTRQLGGASVWVKPAKFAASVVASAPVLAWMLFCMGPATRGLRRAAFVFTTALGLELVLITIQAARGVPSHFNFATTPNAVIFQMMAVTISAFWIAQGWLTFKAFRFRFADPAIGWGIRMGLLLSTLGAGLAFTMTAGPTPQQAAAMKHGPLTMVGGHAVGVEDGGPGLPGTRWSTQGGDLRIAHFLGLHSLQVLPLFGLWLSRRSARKPGLQRHARIVTLFAAGYTALILTTLAQALRGLPLFKPDLPIVSAAVLSLAITVLAVAMGVPRRLA